MILVIVSIAIAVLFWGATPSSPSIGIMYTYHFIINRPFNIGSWVTMRIITGMYGLLVEFFMVPSAIHYSIAITSDVQLTPEEPLPTLFVLLFMYSIEIWTHWLLFLQLLKILGTTLVSLLWNLLRSINISFRMWRTTYSDGIPIVVIFRTVGWSVRILAIVDVVKQDQKGQICLIMSFYLMQCTSEVVCLNQYLSFCNSSHVQQLLCEKDLSLDVIPVSSLIFLYSSSYMISRSWSFLFIFTPRKCLFWRNIVLYKYLVFCHLDFWRSYEANAKSRHQYVQWFSNFDNVSLVICNEVARWIISSKGCIDISISSIFAIKTFDFNKHTILPNELHLIWQFPIMSVHMKMELEKEMYIHPLFESTNIHKTQTTHFK